MVMVRDKISCGILLLAIFTTFTVPTAARELGYDSSATTCITEDEPYVLLNPSFENGLDYPWEWEAIGINEVNLYTEEGYYGQKSVKMYRETDTVSLWQDINLGIEQTEPKEEDVVEAGVWIKSEVSFSSGSFVINVLAIDGDNTEVIARKDDLNVTTEELGEWKYIKAEPVRFGKIPIGADKIRIKIESTVTGSLYVDFVQSGPIASINGNPTKFAIGEFHPWYGNWSNNPSWFNWKHEDKNPDNIIDGQKEIAAAYYPIINAYDSLDPNVISWQVDMTKAMLIDCLMVNYYGATHRPTYHDVFEQILDKVKTEDIRAVVLYEPKSHFNGWIPHDNRTESLKAVEEDIRTIVREWGAEKAYLKYNGLPVVAIFGMAYLGKDILGKDIDPITGDEWNTIQRNLSETRDTALFIGDVITDLKWENEDLEWYYWCFSGMFNWQIYNDRICEQKKPSRSDIKTYATNMNFRAQRWAEYKSEDHRFHISIVWPGFNDSGVKGWTNDSNNTRTEPYAVENEGDFYDETIEAVLEEDPDWVMVATINDWNEGTAIEPSVEKGYLYAVKTQNFLETFKGTDHVDDNLMQQITENYLRNHGKIAILISPSGTIDSVNPTYVWNTSERATEYELRVRNETETVILQSYTPEQVDPSSTGTCSITTDIFLGNGDYLWSVRVHDNNGLGLWNNRMPFTVESPRWDGI